MSHGWLGDENIKRMEFTQNLPIRGGYVRMHNLCGYSVIWETAKVK